MQVHTNAWVCTCVGVLSRIGCVRVRSIDHYLAAMISIELWRARIGSFHCRWSCRNATTSNGSSFSSSFRLSSKSSSSLRHHSVRILGETLLVLTSITVVAVLLLASGDVEMNPGPRIFGKPKTIIIILEFVKMVSCTSLLSEVGFVFVE